MPTKYGVKINFKKSGETVVRLPEPYEWRKGEPVFALGNSDGSSNLETAASIRQNWNAWSYEYFTHAERLTVDEANSQKYEIL